MTEGERASVKRSDDEPIRASWMDATTKIQGIAKIAKNDLRKSKGTTKNVKSIYKISGTVSLRSTKNYL
jgi:hypothetical protein